MVPAIAGALIGAGSSGLNAGASAAGNASQRRYNSNMYSRQRADGMMDWNMQNWYNNEMWNKNNAYNEEMWMRQNAYNEQRWKIQNEYDSPQAQMQRWKEAGINPFAMFGNMSSGQGIDASKIADASAPNAAQTRGASVGSYNPHIPQFDLSNGIMTMLDARYKGAQIDNLKKQNELLDTEKLLKLLDVDSKSIGNESAGYNRDILKNSWSGSVDLIQQQVRKMKQDYEISANRDFRESRADMRSEGEYNRGFQRLQSELATAIESRKLMVSQREGQALQRKLMEYEIELNSMGLQKTDGFLKRMLGRNWDKPILIGGNSLKDLYNQIMNEK